jgi:hypothetical protein
MKKYFLVFAFDAVKTDFVFPAVFSKKEDAEDFCKENDLKCHNEKLPIIEESMENVIDHLLSARLGKLHDILIKLEARI